MRITILTPRPWIRIFLSALLLAPWIILEVDMVPGWLLWAGTLLSEVSIWNIMVLLWGVLFTAGGILLLYHFLRLLFGREIIDVGDRSISRQVQLFSPGKTRTYTRDQIGNMKLSSIQYPEYRSWPRSNIWWDKGDGPIVFDYRSKTVRMGTYLDEAEAMEIMRAIVKRYPQYSEVLNPETQAALASQS